MARRLRTYVFENIDGTNEAMVEAANLKDACAAVGITEYAARQYGWRLADWYDGRAASEAKSGTVFYRRIDDGLREYSPDRKAALWSKKLPAGRLALQSQGRGTG